jgi:hypothetical protein
VQGLDVAGEGGDERIAARDQRPTILVRTSFDTRGGRFRFRAFIARLKVVGRPT